MPRSSEKVLDVLRAAHYDGMAIDSLEAMGKQILEALGISEQEERSFQQWARTFVLAHVPTPEDREHVEAELLTDPTLWSLFMPTKEPPAPALLQERYWCGCVRLARWERCPSHTALEHDREPPPQASSDPHVAAGR